MNPIIIDRHAMIIAGAGRLAAARLLGLDTIPVIRIEDMSEAQKRAYVLADNKLAENAGWRRRPLARGVLAGATGSRAGPTAAAYWSRPQGFPRR